MRIMFTIITVSLIALVGCVTMPNPVPDMYLMEKSAEEENSMEKLSMDIIAKNHEIQEIRSKINGIKHTLEVENGRLLILQEEKNLLLKKQKQYVLENDQTNIDNNKKMTVDKDNEIISQTDRVEYTSALLEDTIAQDEVIETELAVFVAELNYKKANIAKAYLLKQQSAIGEDSKKKKEVAETYVVKYQQHMDKQREILADKKNELEKTTVKLKMAEEKNKK